MAQLDDFVMLAPAKNNINVARLDSCVISSSQKTKQRKCGCSGRVHGVHLCQKQCKCDCARGHHDVHLMPKTVLMWLYWTIMWCRSLTHANINVNMSRELLPLYSNI
jgi:hypothetical protein